MQVLTISQICERLKIGRTAFYNLRKRDANFPTPVLGDYHHKRYDAREVNEWYNRAVIAKNAKRFK